MVASLYLGAAALIVAGGVVWILRLRASRRQGAPPPEAMSPVGGPTLLYAAAVAAGAVVAIVAGNPAPPWTEQVFTAATFGLAARCLELVLRRHGPAVVVALAVLSAAAGAGTVLG